MKKIVSLLICIALLITFLTGCSTEIQTAANDKLSITCTSFPQYDWVKNILGDEIANFNVTLLNDQGLDMHSFQPTAQNMLSIAGADLFIYVGGFSEKWVEQALKSAGNIQNGKDVMSLFDFVNKQEEILSEGMEIGHDHEDEEAHEDGEIEYDEHIWLSLSNASKSCKAIADAICKIDPDNKDTYQANLKAYTEKLAKLDEQYRSTIESAQYDTLLFADRFPFIYLTEEYGLSYFAAFPGCSAETEASFETVVFLAGKIDELKLPAVIIIESSDAKIAETVVASSESKSAEILTLDSMQSVTKDDIAEGITYLSVMESNLTVLETALN